MASRRVAQTRSARWMCGREGRRESKLGGEEMIGSGGCESVAAAMGW